MLKKRVARNEKFARPVERIENFDTSSNFTQQVKKQPSTYNNHQQKNEPLSYPQKPNPTSTYSNNYQQQQQQQSWSSGQNENKYNQGIKRENHNTQFIRAATQDNDEDELLLSVDLQSLDGQVQQQPWQQQQKQQRPHLVSNALNIQSRGGVQSNVKPQLNSQGNSKIKRMPSEEISVECMNNNRMVI